MKTLLFIAFFVLNAFDGESQSFVRDLSDFRRQSATKSDKSQPVSSLQEYRGSLEDDLDTVFKAYNLKTGFDFNQADSLFIIVSTPDDLLSYSDVIVWSGRDTLYYKQSNEGIVDGNFRRHVEYMNLDKLTDKLHGYEVVSDVDSIMTLIQGRNYALLNVLAERQDKLAGDYIAIYLAVRFQSKYSIQVLRLGKIDISATYRKL